MKPTICLLCVSLWIGCHGAGDPTPSGTPPLDAGSGGLSSPPDPGTHPPPVDSGGGSRPSSLSDLCDAEPVTPSDWDRCYRKRWCEWEVGCVVENSYRSVDDCVADSDNVEGGFLLAQFRSGERAIDDGLSAINVPAFTQCLYDLSPDRCLPAVRSAACATRYQGTIADGDACRGDSECATPGAKCAMPSACTDACCQGSCQPPPADGDACGDDSFCAPGSVCHHVCMPGDIGSTCVSSNDCDSDKWCDNGVCAPTYAEGAPCTRGDQCLAPDQCIGLSLVDPTPGTCRRSARAGDPCDVICFGNLYCDGTGTCQELSTLHEACSPFVPCSGYDTICSADNECVWKAALGAACSDDQPCMPGLFCGTEIGEPATCLAPRALGQPCTSAGQCASFVCSGSAGAAGTCQPWLEICSTP